MKSDDVKDGQVSYLNLGTALLTPDLLQFSHWARDVIVEKEPVEALQAILMAMFKPLANLIGGPDAAAALVEREISKLSATPLESKDVAAMTRGLVNGFRLGQIVAGSAILSGGAIIPIDMATIVKSEVRVPDIQKPDNWIGKSEGDLLNYRAKDTEGGEVLKKTMERIGQIFAQELDDQQKEYRRNQTRVVVVGPKSGVS